MPTRSSGYNRAVERALFKSAKATRFVRFGNDAEQAVTVQVKRCRPATGRAILNGRAPRSDDGEPEQRFSGLRSGFRSE
jgi:hypothetical protein